MPTAFVVREQVPSFRFEFLASLPVGTRGRYGTGLCPARAQASIRSPAGRVERGGRQVQRKALKPAWCRVIPPTLHSRQPTGQQPASADATQLGARDPEARRHYWTGHYASAAFFSVEVVSFFLSSPLESPDSFAGSFLRPPRP